MTQVRERTVYPGGALVVVCRAVGDFVLVDHCGSAHNEPTTDISLADETASVAVAHTPLLVLRSTCTGIGAQDDLAADELQHLPSVEPALCSNKGSSVDNTQSIAFSRIMR